MLRPILFQLEKCNIGLQSFAIVFVWTREPILSIFPQLPEKQRELVEHWNSMATGSKLRGNQACLSIETDFFFLVLFLCSLKMKCILFLECSQLVGNWACNIQAYNWWYPKFVIRIEVQADQVFISSSDIETGQRQWLLLPHSSLPM